MPKAIADAVEEMVDTVVTEAPSGVVAEKGAEKEPAKKEDEAEFLIRRIAEEVTKSLANLFPKPSTTDDEDETKPIVPRKKRRVIETTTVKRSFLERLKFPSGK
jgi:acetyl-CoA carboxylase carboxyltransferase component